MKEYYKAVRSSYELSENLLAEFILYNKGDHIAIGEWWSVILLDKREI